TASKSGHGDDETLCIRDLAVAVFTVVKAENLFVNVTREMKRLNANVGSFKPALQERPEVLNAVRVNPTANVSLSVIHYVMHEAIVELVIADRFIGVDRRAMLHVLEYFILQCLTLH